MAHLRMHRPPTRGHWQRGLTLVEFMVSVTIGLLMVAAIATLIADQSGNRAEVDRSGRMIENGRYAVRAVADDLQLSGYWGELNGVPTVAVLAALPNPCSTTLADIEAASQLHVQGYDNPAPAAVTALGCINNQLAGTDILVVRHADPDPSSLQTAGVTDLAKLADGQVYIQTGLNLASSAFIAAVAVGNAASNAASFPLVKKDKVTRATVRKFVVRIYYIAQCSVESAGSCAAGDGGSPIPTLKMLELNNAAGAVAWAAPVTIAEGIENMQIDYGIDSNADGAPDGDNVLSPAAVGDWPNVMAVQVHLLARSLDRSPAFVDDKAYVLGAGGAVATAGTGFKRHVFVQSVRMVNPSARRQS
jgi:type IV pilus assembly protein PilW